MPRTNRATGNAVFKSLLDFKPYQDSKRVGIYLSMPTGEIQTDAIVRHALQAGKQVFVPYLHKTPVISPDVPRSVMEMVDLKSISDYESLERDSWGIPTINADTVNEREHIIENTNKTSGQLDLILMPGVAFGIDTESGFVKRLGHGKGFYDYFLHRYMRARGSQAIRSKESPIADALLCALALEEQFLYSGSDPSIPIGEHDSLLHGVVLGNGNIVESPLHSIGPKDS
jgi:5-formyltetrahydrofolate cyclo-ligase